MVTICFQTSFIDGTWDFVCQHGINECLGNMYHSCALAKYNRSESAAFINCMMTSFDAPNDAEECATELGLDFGRLSNCYTSWEGTTLLAANGIKTHDLEPTLYYVPWILYQDMWTEEDMTGSEFNLLGVVCEKLANSTSRPPQCT